MEYIFTLPNGYVDSQGRLHTRVVLRELGGYEEELLASSAQPVSAKQVTEVLARCIVKLGELEVVDQQIVRCLLIEDRLFLLLKLRQITFGDFIQSVINCPASDCSEKIDIDFNISDIQFEQKKDIQKYFQLTLSENSIRQCGLNERQVEFRLPNGGDQEIASLMMTNNPAEVMSFLLSRCIKKFAGKGALSFDEVTALPALTRLEIERAIEDSAGDTDLSMVTQCPHCKIEFDLPFDIHDFFFDELKVGQQRLYSEVHYLAYHYHWSEKEIMSMSKEKRGRYVTHLSDEIERLNNACA